jgi:hypothetical protein
MYLRTSLILLLLQCALGPTASATSTTTTLSASNPHEDAVTEIVSDGAGGYDLQVTFTLYDYDTTIANYAAAASSTVVFFFYITFLG